MDFAINTEVKDLNAELNLSQENYLLDIIKEICSEPGSKISSKLKGKVNRIISDCDLKHHSSLHKVSTADESTVSVLGFMHQSAAELTFDEQAELNQLFLQKIEKKIPTCISELDNLKQSMTNCHQLRKDELKVLQERDEQLNTLQEQESEKMELMVEWLNHRIHGVARFSDKSSDLLTLKTKILNLKSKILHLQILQNIFTETNQSIKAYSEIHKDLKESIKQTEQRIKNFREIIESDYK